MLIAPAAIAIYILLRKLAQVKQDVLRQQDDIERDIEEFNAEHYETFDDNDEPQDIGRVKRRIYVEIEEAQRRGIPLGQKYDALTSINKADLKAIGEQFGWKQSSVSKASGKPYAEAYFGSLKRAYNAISGTTHVVKDETGNTILTWRDPETAAEQEASRKRLEEIERDIAETRKRIRANKRKPIEQILREEREQAHQERHMTIQDQILAKWPYLKTYTPENPKGEVRNDFQYVWWVEIKNKNREVQAAGPKAAYMRREDAPIERTRTINQYYGYEITPSAYTTQKLIPVADVNLNSRGVGRMFC